MILLLSLLLSFSAHASRTSVVLFGGYGATSAQMNCWEQGARGQAAYDGYFFKGIPFPAGAGAGMESAVAVGSKTIQSIVKQIDSHPDVHFVIAGHSSGAALSNRVAQLVKNPKQIELVDLDGFAPSAALQKKVKSTCVYAVNRKTGLTSRNASSMKGNCANSMKYEDTSCQTQWCLHFTLVNSKAPANLSGADFKKSGYQGCASNLSWLPKRSRPAPAPSEEMDEEPAGSAK
jgi:hypothetical protein